MVKGGTTSLAVRVESVGKGSAGFCTRTPNEAPKGSRGLLTIPGLLEGIGGISIILDNATWRGVGALFRNVKLDAGNAL